MTFRNILVPVDLNDESTLPTPLATAVELAKPGGAKVHVMTVVPDEMIKMTVVAQYIPKDFERQLRDDAIKQLSDAIGKCAPQGADIHQIVHLGNIVHEIIETARDMEADLIVMAAHKPQLVDFLTGSTTEQVVRRAPCSVLVVRESKPAG